MCYESLMRIVKFKRNPQTTLQVENRSVCTSRLLICWLLMDPIGDRPPTSMQWERQASEHGSNQETKQLSQGEAGAWGSRTFSSSDVRKSHNSDRLSINPSIQIGPRAVHFLAMDGHWGLYKLMSCIPARRMDFPMPETHLFPLAFYAKAHLLRRGGRPWE